MLNTGTLLGLGSLLLIYMPTIIYDLSTQTTYWVGGRIYNYYFPEIKDIDILKMELHKLRFELDEFKNNEWIII